jgi:hypothetical protein
MPGRAIRAVGPPADGRDEKGLYRIVGQMPDRDGDHIHRIKSPVEEYGRAVKEGLLVKSQGYLPEEIKDQGPREASITLPSLLHVEKGRSSMFCRWARSWAARHRCHSPRAGEGTEAFLTLRVKRAKIDGL